MRHLLEELIQYFLLRFLNLAKTLVIVLLCQHRKVTVLLGANRRSSHVKLVHQGQLAEVTALFHAIHIRRVLLTNDTL